MYLYDYKDIKEVQFEIIEQTDITITVGFDNAPIENDLFPPDYLVVYVDGFILGMEMT